jgi:hypothetical protein
LAGTVEPIVMIARSDFRNGLEVPCAAAPPIDAALAIRRGSERSNRGSRCSCHVKAP